MNQKYLKSNFDANQKRLERVVSEKIAVLRIDIEMFSNKVFLFFEELLIAEQMKALANEDCNEDDRKFSFGYWFLALTIIPGIYAIDLLLSQDVIIYLLPASMSEETKMIFTYIVPLLFVIFDVGIGLVRHKIKIETEKEDNQQKTMLLINITGILFCLILPVLVGATILAFLESSEIQLSEVTARLALMVLSLVLHAFVIFLFPKNAFDYVFSFSTINSTNKLVNQSERKLFKAISELNIKVLQYKQKADTYDFVTNLDDIDFAFRTKVLINQIVKNTEWMILLENNPKLQAIISQDPFLNRYFPYRKPIIIKEDLPEKVPTETIEKPKEEVKNTPRQIFISYIQNDSAYQYLS